MPTPPPPVETRWKPGVSPNPGGKPKGARNKLQGDFLNTLAEHFALHGKKAIERACEEDPMGYIKAIASLMPKQVEDAKPLEDLNDAELNAGIAILRARLSQGSGAGTNETSVQTQVN